MFLYISDKKLEKSFLERFHLNMIRNMKCSGIGLMRDEKDLHVENPEEHRCPRPHGLHPVNKRGRCGAGFGGVQVLKCRFLLKCIC